VNPHPPEASLFAHCDDVNIVGGRRISVSFIWGWQLFIRPFDCRQNVMLLRNQRRFARLSLLPDHFTWRVIRAKHRQRPMPFRAGNQSNEPVGYCHCLTQGLTVVKCSSLVSLMALRDLLVSDGNLLRRKATGPFHLFIRLAKFNRPALDQGDRPDLSRPATGKFSLNRLYYWRLHLPMSKGGKSQVICMCIHRAPKLHLTGPQITCLPEHFKCLPLPNDAGRCVDTRLLLIGGRICSRFTGVGSSPPAIAARW